MIVDSVTHDSTTQTLYILDKIVVYVVNEDSDLEVWASHNVDFVRRVMPKICYRRGVAKVHGLEFTKLKLQLGTVVIDSDVWKSRLDMMTYIIDDYTAIVFHDQNEKPELVESYLPIIAVPEEVLCCVEIYAHNVFNALVVYHNDKVLGYVKISSIVDHEVYVVKTRTAWSINDELRIFITAQHELYTETGKYYKLRNVQDIAPIWLNGRDHFISMDFSNQRQVKYVSNGQIYSDATYMFSKHTNMPCIVEDVGNFRIAYYAARLLYWQPIDSKYRIEMHDGVLTMIGDSMRLLENLMQTPEHISIGNGDYYALSANGNVYQHNGYPCGTPYIIDADNVLFIPFGDKRPTMCEPIAQIRLFWCQSPIAYFDQFEDIFHLVNGTVAFIANRKIYVTLDKFESASIAIDYTIRMNGEICYFSRGELVNTITGKRVLTKSVYNVPNVYNRTGTITFNGTEVTFNTLDCTQIRFSNRPNIWTAQTRDGKFIAVNCIIIRPRLHFGRANVIPNGIHTKPALRAPYDDE